MVFFIFQVNHLFRGLELALNRMSANPRAMSGEDMVNFDCSKEGNDGKQDETTKCTDQSVDSLPSFKIK